MANAKGKGISIEQAKAALIDALARLLDAEAAAFDHGGATQADVGGLVLDDTVLFNVNVEVWEGGQRLGRNLNQEVGQVGASGNGLYLHRLGHIYLNGEVEDRSLPGAHHVLCRGACNASQWNYYSLGAHCATPKTSASMAEFSTP